MKKIQTIMKVSKRGRRVEFRLNDEEYDIGLKNATACGMSISEYGRKCFVDQTPKLHLTEREIGLTRASLMHVVSWFMSGMP